MKLPKFLAIDAGGTMTDTIIVDDNGDFVIGKAQTTPDNESIGLINSTQDALKYWDLNLSSLTAINCVIYSGTAMLNKILTQTGNANIGIITTYGYEDTLRMGRGCQSYLGYHYPDRLHSVSHKHPEPLVNRKLIKGVHERINVYGEIIVPLYEKDVEDAVNYFIQKKVSAIIVSFLFSFRNPMNEVIAEQIINQMLQQNNLSLPIFCAYKYCPIRGELPRLNTLVAQCYAAYPSKEQFVKIKNKLQENNCNAPIRLMTSYGGTIPAENDWLVQTLVSGPIGGILGAKYLSQILQVDNLCCSDVGGTSFDVGLISEGNYAINLEPDLAKLKLAIPQIAMDSIGAGTGTYIRVDEVSNRIELGPDSAGYKIGVCWEESGLETPTINDCNLVLGYINPDYFLGGEIKLNKEIAEKVLKEKITDKLNLKVTECAYGIVKLLETQMRDHIYAMIQGRGFSPLNYYLLSYGGGGPTHTIGYTEGLGVKKILVPTFAAAFSAFGCACADYSYRLDRQLDIPIYPQNLKDDMVISLINGALGTVNFQLQEQIKKDGIKQDFIFAPYLRMQYMGMLDDLEIKCPYPLTKDNIENLIADFEALFTKIFSIAARSPEAGYLITRAVGVGIIPTSKPVMKKRELQNNKPQTKAKRLAYFGDFYETTIYEMEDILPGNEIIGPAIIESPSTTFVIPPKYKVFLNEYLIFEVIEV